MSYTLKHPGAQIDELLDKADTAVQPEEIEPLATMGYVNAALATATAPLATKDYVGEELAAAIAPLATKVELSDAVQGLKTHLDEKDIETFNLAKSYTDEAMANMKDYVDEALANAEGGGTDEILQIIEENELVAAQALNDLNDRKADKEFVTDAIASAITTTLNTAV